MEKIQVFLWFFEGKVCFFSIFYQKMPALTFITNYFFYLSQKKFIRPIIINSNKFIFLKVLTANYFFCWRFSFTPRAIIDLAGG